MLLRIPWMKLQNGVSMNHVWLLYPPALHVIQAGMKV